MGVEWNDVNTGSNGGTEMMMRALEANVSKDLLDNFQIIASRVRAPLDESKVRILWCHDTEDDGEVAHLADGGWRKFHRIVFVSYTQMHGYIRKFNIPWSRCVVIQNAITPIPLEGRPSTRDGVRLIYTSTPHRGLNILVASFEELARRRDDVFLEVYSSFGLYGWDDRDRDYQEIFDRCRSHERITYSGAVPNEEVRKALQRSHVLAYPSTWVETSCLCLIEAMSADLICVHSSLGALPETAANWSVSYPFHEDPAHHAGIFFSALEAGIQAAESRWGGDEKKGPSSQKNYTDLFYDWKNRAHQWTAFLESLLGEDRSIQSSGEEFVFRVG